MFLLLSIFIFALCIIIFTIQNRSIILTTFTAIVFSCFFISNVCFCTMGIEAIRPSNIERLNVRQEFLEANKHNDYLAEDILKWNEDLTYNQRIQRSKWVGIYIPNIFDNFHIIDPTGD